MQSFEIGLTGLHAARKSLDTIGNNIANAATDGYHRQRTELVPAISTYDGHISWGGGVDVAAVSRAIDTLLEEEILNQNGLSGQSSEELTVLQTIENTFGELPGDGRLSQAFDQFFNALQDLSAHPSETVYQRQVVTSAQALANQFQTIGTSLADMAERIDLQVDETVTRINELAAEIASLNEQIQHSEVVGSPANNLRDERDQQIYELSKLVPLVTRQQDYGVVDVSVGGIPLVIGSDITKIETGLIDADTLGIGVGGTTVYRTMEGGKLGGLLSLRNEILTEIQDEFDTLARTIIRTFNDYHVQGVGSEGAFSDLTGWNVDSDVPLEALGLDITDGKLYVRVTNTDTGEVSRAEVEVDASVDTLETLASKIDALAGVNASVLSSKLHIGADKGYEFDFLPASLPEPDETDFAVPAGAPDITVSGIYTGDANDVLTFTVQGGGSTGNGDWSIVVTNQDGDTVTTLDVGSGYVAGETVDLGNGIKVALGVGDLADGDTFTVEALADTDTSGVLAAVGLNTFFSGTDAQTMAVLSGFDDSPGRVATALGSDYADNTNVARLSGLKNEVLDDLNGQTISNYYDILVTTVGQDITLTKMRQDNIEAMLQDLMDRRSEASGVDINDESAKILIFEQMYQAMARFMNSVQTTTETLLNLL
jgi:flagellar hook-associated protein 1 FlgK